MDARFVVFVCSPELVFASYCAFYTSILFGFAVYLMLAVNTRHRNAILTRLAPFRRVPEACGQYSPPQCHTDAACIIMKVIQFIVWTTRGPYCWLVFSMRPHSLFTVLVSPNVLLRCHTHTICSARWMLALSSLCNLQSLCVHLSILFIRRSCFVSPCT